MVSLTFPFQVLTARLWTIERHYFQAHYGESLKPSTTTSSSSMRASTISLLWS